MSVRRWAGVDIYIKKKKKTPIAQSPTANRTKMGHVHIREPSSKKKLSCTPYANRGANSHVTFLELIRRYETCHVSSTDGFITSTMWKDTCNVLSCETPCKITSYGQERLYQRSEPLCVGWRYNKRTAMAPSTTKVGLASRKTLDPPKSCRELASFRCLADTKNAGVFLISIYTKSQIEQRSMQAVKESRPPLCSCL